MKILYTHKFICGECKLMFDIHTYSPEYSMALGTKDLMPVCPICKSNKVYMDDVTELFIEK